MVSHNRVLQYLAGAVMFATLGAADPAAAADEIKIVTVVDNEVVDAGLESRWGFSAAVLTPKGALLFDTGPDGAALLANLARLDMEPRQFGKVLISHGDSDHAAGIEAFVPADPEAEILLPGKAAGLDKKVRDTGAAVSNVMEAGEIAPGLRSTGPMGGKQEQALLIETRDGLVVMTGCAHPGIVDIVQKAQSLNPGKRILLAMGGFHLFQTPDTKTDAIVDELRRLKVEKVAPSHCTGRYARERFRQVYGADYIAGGVGLTLTFHAP